jgi:hypothetical protein
MTINCIYRDQRKCIKNKSDCIRMRNPSKYCDTQIYDISYNTDEMNIQVSYDEDGK